MCGGIFVSHLLVFCSKTCSLLLSADRILGSTSDSNVSNITGSKSFSRACSVFTYWHKDRYTHCHPWEQKQARIKVKGLNTVTSWCVSGRLTLCCSMASRALNSKGRECDCEASCGASSRTNQRSKLSPRKSNTSKDSGVTMAFKDWKKNTQTEDPGVTF